MALHRSIRVEPKVNQPRIENTASGSTRPLAQPPAKPTRDLVPNMIRPFRGRLGVALAHWARLTASRLHSAQERGPNRVDGPANAAQTNTVPMMPSPIAIMLAFVDSDAS